MASRTRKILALLALALLLCLGAAIGIELFARASLATRVADLRTQLSAPTPDGLRPTFGPAEEGDAADVYRALEWVLGEHEADPDAPAHPLPAGEWSAGMPAAEGDDLYALDLAHELVRTGDTAWVVELATDILVLNAATDTWFQDEDDLPALVAMMNAQRQRYRPLLALVAEAQRRDRCRWVDTLLSPTQGVAELQNGYRAVVDLLALEAWEAPPREAVERSLEAVGVGLDLARRPFLLWNLVGITISQLGLSLVAEQLGRPLDEASLGALQEGLTRLALPPAGRTLDEEQVFNQCVVALQAGRELDAALPLPLSGIEPGPWYERLALRVGYRWSGLERVYQDVAEALALPPAERWRELSAIAARDDSEASDLAAVFRRWSVTRLHWTAQRDCLRLLCEVRGFALREGRWPEPGELGATFPDPFAPEQPLRWERMDRGLRAWSVGEDGEDDGGRLGPEEDGIEHSRVSHFPDADSGAEIRLAE